MEKEKNNEEVWLKEYVESEFKGKLFKFFPLDFQNTFEFLDLFSSDVDPRLVVKNNFDKVKEFISKSLKVDVGKMQNMSAGFVMWGFKNIFEAIDFEYLIESSRDIREKFQNLIIRMEKNNPDSLPELLEGSAEKKDGPPITS